MTVTAELRERLPEYVFGALSADERAVLEQALAEAPELAAEAEALSRAVADALVTPAVLPRVAPSEGARSRLLAAVDGSERFSPFVDRLSQLFDMTVEAVRALLARVDDATTWGPGLPGMLYQHFTPGPRLVKVDAGLIRLEPGVSFPRHRHLAGNEITFVLEGSMVDGDRVYGPGSVVEHAEDTVHGYAATPDRPLTIIVVNHGIAPVFDPPSGA